MNISAEPCIYCGHSECGGGRPYDSPHQPRYCVACWSEDQMAKQTIALQDAAAGYIQIRSDISEDESEEPPQRRSRPEPQPYRQMPQIEPPKASQTIHRRGL